MYIDCPKCNAKFKLTEKHSIANKKRFKCANCKHIWNIDDNIAWNTEDQERYKNNKIDFRKNIEHENQDELPTVEKLRNNKYSNNRKENEELSAKNSRHYNSDGSININENTSHNNSIIIKESENEKPQEKDYNISSYKNIDIPELNNSKAEYIEQESKNLCKNEFVGSTKLQDETRFRQENYKDLHLQEKTTDDNEVDISENTNINTSDIQKESDDLELQKNIIKNSNMYNQVHKFLYVYPILAVGLVFGMMFLGSKITVSHLKDLLSNNNIMLENLSVDMNNSKDKMLISCNIINKSDANITLPIIRIRLLDSNRNVIDTHFIHKPDTTKPNQPLKISAQFKNFSSESKFVDISLGTWQGFMIW